MSLQSDNTRHPDLQLSRIKRGDFDVTSIIDMLENNLINHLLLETRDLVSISTGFAVLPDVPRLVNSKTKGRGGIHGIDKEIRGEKKNL